jgi:predicted phage baseplate assembly protein
VTNQTPPRTCLDDRRRLALREQRACGGTELNGIDYVEVDDSQRVLTVFLIDKAPEHVAASNVRVDGGRRVTGINVVSVRLRHDHDPDVVDRLTVEVDRPGDFSTYTLRLVEADAHGRPGTAPLAGFDPRYAEVDFHFKAGCPTGLDCAPSAPCPPVTPDEPEISYLAKDYSSFRRLILDRLALVMPGWTETHVPDLGIALVELLAYVGDQLSYYQDAVATEAYLGTARRRVSVRRHGRLVDYLIHEGCNARAWVHLTVQGEAALPPDVSFITDPGVAVRPHDTLDRIAGAFEVFRPVGASGQTLRAAHNTIRFYTWGDRDCCLPEGATSATLLDPSAPPAPPPNPAPPADVPDKDQARHGHDQAHHGHRHRGWHGDPPPHGDHGGHEPPEPTPAPVRSLGLVPGDVLIFEEVIGPKTGSPDDADPRRRVAVRLTKVTQAVDTLFDQTVVEVEWDDADALPFSFCLSTIGPAPNCLELTDVSVARGNVVLVDHGRPWTAPPWVVPTAEAAPAGCRGVGDPREPHVTAAPFAPQLSAGPLTCRVPFPAPADVSRRQAKELGRLIGRALARVTGYLAAAGEGERLTWQVGVIEALFGAQALREAGLAPVDEGKGRPQEGRPKRGQTPQEQAKAVAWLLARAGRLLEKKSERLAALARRARGGYVLGASQVAEVGDLIDAPSPDGRLAAGLAATDPRLAGPASSALAQNPRQAVPQISLFEGAGATGPRWCPRPDLLASGPDDRAFVVETDDEGVASLRFGDGNLGRAPDAGATLQAFYRVGNGTTGNVGAETISVVVFGRQSTDAILGVRNPLPAAGGVNPEPVDEAKRFAPVAFRDAPARAVTAADYASIASTFPGVQRAAATLRWTGSGYFVRVAVDPLGTDALSKELRHSVLEGLQPYRRLGHDLEVVGATYVPVELALTVCVLPDYVRGHVKSAVLALLGDGVSADGTVGFFHPDRLTFGVAVAASKIVALVQGVPGVENVRVDRLRRLGGGPNSVLSRGLLPIGPLEVARLDGDANDPENGVLSLTLRGGR